MTADYTVIRKMVGLMDLQQMVSLEISEKDENNNVMLNNYSIEEERSLSTVEYSTLNSKQG